MSVARTRLSPELIAGLISVLLLAVVFIRVPARTTAAQPTPEEPRASAAPTPVDGLGATIRSSLNAVVAVNEHLAGVRRDLQTELARKPPRVNQIRILLPQISQETTAAGGPVQAILGSPATASLGTQLEDAYGALNDLARTALGESVQNEPVYLKAASDAVKQIEALQPLTVRAGAILAGALRSAAPSGGPGASGVPASGSAPPSRPPVSAPPSGAPPSASTAPSVGPPGSVAPGGLIANGGFENGLSSWILRTVSPAAATLVGDRTQRVEGAASARVDIASNGSGARTSISLVQGGIDLRAGQSYVVQLAVRAAAPREVRLQVTTAAGQGYMSRILEATTTWTTLTFQLDSLVDDPSAELTIDLGQSTATVWVDAVGVRELGA